MGPSDLSSLAEACRRGEESAFAELFERFAPAVLHVARRVLRDEQESNDVMQETFLVAFRRISTFRGEGSLRAWLVRIALRTALRFRRRRRSEPSLEEEWVPEPPSAREEPSDLEFKQAVTLAVDQLPERSRLVFVLHASEGWSHAEIGAALGIDEGTSKSQLSYARSLLRRKLARFADGSV